MIRNPKRYFFQMTALVMTSYIVVVEANDILLLLANQNQITSERYQRSKRCHHQYARRYVDLQLFRYNQRG